jgi:hypothetical protein
LLVLYNFLINLSGRKKMNRDKLYFVLIGLMVLTLVFGYPSPAATQDATPTTEATAEAEAPKWCSNTNIVFFPGGAPGGPFESVVYNGALQAARLRP